MKLNLTERLLMEKKMYDFKKIGIYEIEIIKELFAGVFTIEA